MIYYLGKKGTYMAFHLVSVQKYRPRCGEAYKNNSIENKNDQKDSSKQCSFISQNQCSSQGIFLPKEWTY
jgi:hypothetical protein